MSPPTDSFGDPCQSTTTKRGSPASAAITLVIGKIAVGAVFVFVKSDGARKDQKVFSSFSVRARASNLERSGKELTPAGCGGVPPFLRKKNSCPFVFLRREARVFFASSSFKNPIATTKSLSGSICSNAKLLFVMGL